MALKVYNYLTRATERFKSIEREQVSMYVCGPTVYDHAHLGHAKTYVAMDTIVRYLRYLGYRVRHVRNITDVGHMLDDGEDRIARGARRDQKDPMEVAETYLRSFNEDMDALGVLPPNISPRATGHIPDMIQWIETLIARGCAYETDGNVYFSVESAQDYGKLAKRDLSDLIAGARVDVRDDKRHPADFALWKHAQPEHIMRWPSPWGEGFPGWHIECSVMATKYLGQPFDIHGGGLENIFPHNECEIAQAEAYQAPPFANYWLLVGSLTVDGAKMSKSLGNFLTIKDALRLYSPEALRYFVLSGHYRNPIEFSRDALQAAQRGVDRLHHTVRTLRRRMDDVLPTSGTGTAALASVVTLDDYREEFRAAMDEDFNTPQALAVIFELVKEANRLLEQDRTASLGTYAVVDKLFRDLAGTVLGLLPDDLEKRAGGRVVEGLMSLLLELRQEFRESKQWAKADALRSRLNDLGILIEDGPEDTTWQLR